MLKGQVPHPAGFPAAFSVHEAKSLSLMFNQSPEGSTTKQPLSLTLRWQICLLFCSVVMFKGLSSEEVPKVLWSSARSTDTTAVAMM